MITWKFNLQDWSHHHFLCKPKHQEVCSTLGPYTTLTLDYQRCRAVQVNKLFSNRKECYSEVNATFYNNISAVQVYQGLSVTCGSPRSALFEAALFKALVYFHNCMYSHFIIVTYINRPNMKKLSYPVCNI